MPTARMLYAIWGAIGLSVLIEFAVLLHLQRQGVASIPPAVAGPGSGAHLALACILFGTAAGAVGILRARVRSPERLARGARRGSSRSPGPSPVRPALEADPAAEAPGRAAAASPAQRVVTRFVALNVLAWAVAESLALVGFALALALGGVPRLALTVYFTGALFLWLWGRPPPAAALEEARRRAATP
ncbi:MAG: hypothetical protein ABR599_09020 [Gemmatimonadota bacterium]